MDDLYVNQIMKWQKIKVVEFFRKFYIIIIINCLLFLNFIIKYQKKKKFDKRNEIYVYRFASKKYR